MALLKITTPVADYTGVCGNVEFVQGVGYADEDTHAAEIGYMRANGYTIEGTEVADGGAGEQSHQPEAPVPAQEPPEPGTPSAPADPPVVGADDKMPARNGSADAWRTYAIAHGMDADEAAELSRDQLVERFTSKEDNK